MAVTPSGTVSEAIDAMLDHVANSSAWQTWSGAADATAGKANLEVMQSDRENPVFPVCLISDEGTETHDRLGTFSNGSMMVRFYDETLDSDKPTPRDVAYRFRNNVSQVMEDVKDRADSFTGLVIRGYSISKALRTDEYLAERDCLFVDVSVDWGPDI